MEKARLTLISGWRVLFSAKDTAALRQIANISTIMAWESAHYRDLGFNPKKFLYWLKSCIRQKSAVLYASVGDRVVGYTLLHIDREWIDKQTLDVVTFYVHPEFRNTGIGGQIADAICEIIIQNRCNYSQISICADFENDGQLIQRATERLFLRRGYYKIGTVMGKKGV